MTRTLPADPNATPASIGTLGIPAHRDVTIDGEEKVADWLARHQVRSVRLTTWHVRAPLVIETTGTELP